MVMTPVLKYSVLRNGREGQRNSNTNNANARYLLETSVRQCVRNGACRSFAAGRVARAPLAHAARGTFDASGGAAMAAACGEMDRAPLAAS